MNDEEDCVEVSMEIGDRGSWNDINCAHGFGYVCKYSKSNNLVHFSILAALKNNSILKILNLVYINNAVSLILVVEIASSSDSGGTVILYLTKILCSCIEFGLRNKT